MTITREFCGNKVEIRLTDEEAAFAYCEFNGIDETPTEKKLRLENERLVEENERLNKNNRLLGSYLRAHNIERAEMLKRLDECRDETIKATLDFLFGNREY